MVGGIITTAVPVLYIEVKASADGARVSSGEAKIPIITDTVSTHGWLFPNSIVTDQEQSAASAYASVQVPEMQNARIKINQNACLVKVPLLNPLIVARATAAIQHYSNAYCSSSEAA
eukprot:6210348-Pleurochrysis_carterae.AAC.3